MRIQHLIKQSIVLSFLFILPWQNSEANFICEGAIQKPEVIEIANPDLAYKTEGSSRINFSEFKNNFFWEYLKKVIKPSLLNEHGRLRRSYRLSSLLSSKSDEIFLGFDDNHMYMILFDSKKKRYTRVDGIVNQPVLIKEGSDKFRDGFMVRLNDLKDDDVDRVLEIIKDEKPYETCAHAGCSILKEIGIEIPTFVGEDTPKETRTMIHDLFYEGLVRDGLPIETTIYSTTSKSLDLFIGDAIKLSSAVSEMRRKTLKGYFIIITNSIETFFVWAFVRH